MDAKQENELFQTLGRIEAKVSGMCEKNKERQRVVEKLADKMSNTFDNLPCHAQYQSCQKDIKTKANSTVVKAVAAALFTLACGAYGYTYMIDDNTDKHAQDYEIHYMEHEKFVDENEKERGGE